MKSGIEMGSTTSTPHSRGSGSRVRATHHAVAVPITAVASVTTAVSSTVLRSSSTDSGRTRTLCTCAQPAPRACHSKNASGSSRATATAAPATYRAGTETRRGRRTRRAGGAAAPDAMPGAELRAAPPAAGG
jgi:hypothetical protein